MIIGRRSTRPIPLRFCASSGLISVVGVLMLVTLLLLFSELLPIFLDVFTLMLPLVSYDFRNLWVGELRVLCSNLRLMMLTVQNKC